MLLEISMDNRLFKEYLYLHKEMTQFLRSVVEQERDINTNIIILCIYVIARQMQKGGPLSREEIFECSVVPNSTLYRIIGKCVEIGVLSRIPDGYSFPYEVPPHLKFADIVHDKFITV